MTETMTNEKPAHRRHVPTSQESRPLPHLSGRNGHSGAPEQPVPDSDPHGKGQSATFANQALIHGDFFELYQTIPEKSVDLFLSDLPFGKFNLSCDQAIGLKELENALNYLLNDTGQIVLYVDLKLMNSILAEFRQFVMRTFFVLRMSTSMPINKYCPLPNLQFVLAMRRKQTKVSELCWHPYEMLPRGKPWVKKSNILETSTRRMKKSPIVKNQSGSRWIKQVIDSPSKSNLPKEERRSVTHPFQKSLQTVRGFIRTFSNEGDLVADGFMGSGTAALAGYLEGRRTIGIEIEETYFKEAQERMRRATAQYVLSSIEPQEDEKSIFEVEEQRV